MFSQEKNMSFQFKEAAGGHLQIGSVKTSKDKIKQPDLAKHELMFIPPLGSSIVISGKSGSGKTTLLKQLLTDHRFYGPSKQKPSGWFDKVFLFSPTANGDDIQKSFNITPDHVFTDLDEGPELLETILNTQQEKLDHSDGADKVEQFCIIFDDIIGDKKFMNTKAFTRCFYQVRHVNCTTFICTQHFKRVPRICRLQSNFVFFFQGSQTEVETVAEEFAPPNIHKKEFMKFVDEATRPDYSFLTINMKVPNRIRFRRNLSEIAFLQHDTDVLFSEPKNKRQTSVKTPIAHNVIGKHEPETDRGPRKKGHRSVRESKKTRGGTLGHRIRFK